MSMYGRHTIDNSKVKKIGRSNPVSSPTDFVYRHGCVPIDQGSLAGGGKAPILDIL